MSGRRVPNGVLAMAAVCFLTAVGFVLLGSVIAVAPATLARSGFRAHPSASIRLWGLCFFGGVGVLCGIAGYGLLRLQRWSYVFIVSLASATLIRVVLNIAIKTPDYATQSTNANVAALVLSVVALCYMWTPGVRGVFGVPRRSDAGG